jgi:hypothetical protein
MNENHLTSGSTSVSHTPNDEQLLSINIIKKSGVYPTIISAEFIFTSNNALQILLLLTGSHQRILIARKQGDSPRSWRSVDRAIDFIKTHFAIENITIKLYPILTRESSYEQTKNAVPA